MILKTQGEIQLKKLITLALAVMVASSLVGCGTTDESSDTAKMPEASSELEGEDYQDVMTRLEVAGFTSIETAALDDLITGWLTNDGEVERVSVNGETDFSSGSRYPVDARIVITYHTFPEAESDEAAESNPVEGETPESATQEAGDTTLTAENSEELEAVLNAQNPGDPEVRAFIEKYKGTTIEFDGYTWDWANHSSDSSLSGETTVYETLFDTTIWVGDVENADVSSVGPNFRVEEFSMPNFSSTLNRMNVRVEARVDGYDEDHEFFQITLLSFEPR